MLKRPLARQKSGRASETASNLASRPRRQNNNNDEEQSSTTRFLNECGAEVVVVNKL